MDSLPTPTTVEAQWLQALDICAKHSVLFRAAGASVAGCFSPQILTDALEGYNSSPSEQAREKWGKTEKCVYHCQSAYTVWHLHDGKLCQFIRAFKVVGAFLYVTQSKSGELALVEEKREFIWNRFLEALVTPTLMAVDAQDKSTAKTRRHFFKLLFSQRFPSIYS